MASLPQPTEYYHPNPASSIMHARPPTVASNNKGSFTPVLAVLAAICFLAVAACVVGRLFGRRSFSNKKSVDDDRNYYYGSSSDDVGGGDPEKGFDVKYPPMMKPVASSRAVIHDIDDGFEIKFAPARKPAAWKNDSKANNNRGHRHHHHPHPQPGVVPKAYGVPKV